MSAGVAACVGLGANLGARAERLREAWTALAADPAIADLVASRVYETAPVGGPPGQGPFLNAAVRLRTTLSPRALLDRLLAIEARAGRVREVRHGPRSLDLDLLLYGDRCVREPGLVVPHPRLHERAFVLVPLCDVAAEWQHPGLGRSVQALAAVVDRRGVTPSPEEPWPLPPSASPPSEKA